jgi:thiosulfate/3-mercaptopyruvate sulfurtransferase
MTAEEGFPGPVVDQRCLRRRPPGATVIADVRWVRGGSARRAFEAGHLPGALLFDIDGELSAPPFDGPGRHPLPSPEAFAGVLGRAGIGAETPVVVYDDVRGSVAARLWWMLDVLGHPVALLDGGLEAWEGLIETGPGRRAVPVPITPRPWPRERIADAGEVASALRSGSAIVIDARAAERYRGEAEPIDPVAGHIPGARNAPWMLSLDEAGSFLGAAELRGRFAELGVTDAARAITQCGSGVTACHAMLAMRLAGLGDGRIYEGSWSDWVSDPSRPVAGGPEPGTLEGVRSSSRDEPRRRTRPR